MDVTSIRFYEPEIDYEGDGIVNAIGADFEIASDGSPWKGHARQDLANMESVDVEWDGDGPPGGESPTLLKEIWQAHWAFNGAADVGDTVLYPLDAWIFRKYFGDHDCDDIFLPAEAHGETEL